MKASGFRFLLETLPYLKTQREAHIGIISPKQCGSVRFEATVDKELFLMICKKKETLISSEHLSHISQWSK